MFGVILYIFLLLSATFLAWQVHGRSACTGLRQARWKVADKILLIALFFLLFLPGALRIYTGNDYMTYIVRFHHVYTDNVVVTEPGFNWIVDGVYHFFRKEYYLIPFGIFAGLTVAFALAGLYRGSRNFGLSVFLYMALGLYFQSYNTVRYYVALSFAICAMAHMARKEYAAFCLYVVLAALFHKTALVILILYPLARIRWNKWLGICLGAAGISGILFPQVYMDIFLRLYPSYVNEPEYLNAGGLSPVNIARCGGMLLLALWLSIAGKKPGDEAGFYIRCNVLALLVYGCFSFVPFTSRIGYYLGISQLFLIPEMWEMLSRKWKKAAMVLVLAGGMLYFSAFLYKADGDLVKILPYSTWLTQTENFDSYNLLRYTE